MNVVLCSLVLIGSCSAFEDLVPRPGPPNPSWALVVLRNQMHAFQGVIRSRNKHILPKIFNLTEGTDAEMDNIFDANRDLKFNAKSAHYVDLQEIHGYVEVVPKSLVRVFLKSRPSSPTGWIIVEMVKQEQKLKSFIDIDGQEK
ncbi:unnamed protein product [Caenorhabditis sp. 36 PRJEB53466]|nr:unnamed protein product [Caenorhabditis sp. 36 PRJEB53466]